jgi:hypothetical protein
VAARDALIESLRRLTVQASEIRGLWLQGSLAAGTADAWSDIDAYLAVDDEAFERVWAERERWLARLGEPMVWSDATVPGLTAVHALMPQGVRLDLLFEPRWRVGQQRRPAVKLLVDKDGVAEQLQFGWTPSAPAIARTLQVIIRMTRQGATWPLRLLGREQWSTLAMMELDLINAQFAQLMAVAADPANFHRNPFSLAPALTDAQRAELDQLTTDALTALGRRDVLALKAVHMRVFDGLVREGRAACVALGVAYPIEEASERAVRDLIEANWPAS